MSNSTAITMIWICIIMINVGSCVRKDVTNERFEKIERQLNEQHRGL